MKEKMNFLHNSYLGCKFFIAPIMTYTNKLTSNFIQQEKNKCKQIHLKSHNI